MRYTKLHNATRARAKVYPTASFGLRSALTEVLRVFNMQLVVWVKKRRE